MTGIELLRTVLQRLRWDDQGGYPGRVNGRWHFVSTGLPQVTPEELDALFSFAGIVPDEIQSLGECRQCKHAVNGHEQGYRGPCLTCKRPKMSNFVPLRRKKRS